MAKAENDVEKYLHQCVTAYGGTTRKWVSPGRDGVPDRIVIHRGKIIFVEVKTMIGELTVRQQREKDALELLGAQVEVVYGKKGVDLFMNKVLAPLGPG